MTFMKFLNTTALVRSPEGEGGSGGSGEGGGGEGGDGSFFDGGEGNGGGEGAGGEGGERPDFLMEKYKTVDDQAKAYGDLYARFSKKTDTLRAEVKDEAVAEATANFAKSAGVPENVADYVYAEGISPAAEELDGDLRSWAQKHSVGAEGFKELTELYGKTLPNHAAETEKLGENAKERGEAVSNWLKETVDPSHFGAAKAALTTAAGVELFEAVMDAVGETGFAPDDDLGEGGEQLTRENIRKMQADERFGDDEAYTAKVREMWARFARKQR